MMFIEIQIKTEEMHNYNEFGPASHIAYKIAGVKGSSYLNYDWVRELTSWRNGQRHQRFKVKVLDKYIYTLTPKGDIIQLRKGSTPVDFAYRVHTEIGNSCQGAKVNGKIVKLNSELKNGDQVEILVNQKQKLPRPDWIKFVKMNDTKSKIRQALDIKYSRKKAS